MSTPKYDIYSNMRVPFDVAAWARDRKLNKNAVALSKALGDLEKAKMAAELAQAHVEACERKIDDVVKTVQTHMVSVGAA